MYHGTITLVSFLDVKIVHFGIIWVPFGSPDNLGEVSLFGLKRETSLFLVLFVLEEMSILHHKIAPPAADVPLYLVKLKVFSGGNNMFPCTLKALRGVKRVLPCRR